MTNNPKEAILALMTNKTHRAFSLVEILVVVSIIAVLGALAFPVFSNAIGKSKTSEAMSNLRQIGNGLMLFIADNNQELPKRWGDSAEDPKDRLHWQEQINEYAGGATDNPNSAFDYTRNNIWKSPFVDQSHGQHYGLNNYMWSRGGGTRWDYKYQRIPNHAAIVIIGEMNRNSSAFDSHVEPAFDRVSNTYYRISHPGNRALYLFADGHVESLAGNQGVDVNPTLWKWW